MAGVAFFWSDLIRVVIQAFLQPPYYPKLPHANRAFRDVQSAGHAPGRHFLDDAQTQQLAVGLRQFIDQPPDPLTDFVIVAIRQVERRQMQA